MAREDLRQTIHKQVQQVIAQGGQLIEGGYIPDMQGFYYPATLIDNVSPDSLAYQEEFFGPVVCISAAKDKQHAIELANQTDFGLGAAIFTKNLALGEQIAAQELEAGLCFVNMPVTSDPRFPFGGIKNSGFGRELSREGMLEFSNIKTVIVHD
jgi:succinate-semialdehyde dehydrogenase/glutarate-semialdehyde dehydrogenase